MAKKLKTSTIEEFSHRVVEHGLLPNGSTIRFTRKKTGRQVRSDFTVKRQHVTTANLPVPTDNMTVSAFLESVGSLLSTDLHARGITMQLFGPEGEYFSGGTRIKNVRKAPGVSTGSSASSVDLLAQIIENANLDVEFSIRDMGVFYHELREMLGDGLDRALEKNAARIRAKGLLSA
jgi:hypothetical protein